MIMITCKGADVMMLLTTTVASISCRDNGC